jgi:hypothetical protein
VFGHQAQLQQKLGGDWVIIAGFGLRETSMIGYSEDAELATGRQPIFSTGTMLACQRRYRDFRTRNITGRAEIPAASPRAPSCTTSCWARMWMNSTSTPGKPAIARSPIRGHPGHGGQQCGQRLRPGLWPDVHAYGRRAQLAGKAKELGHLCSGSDGYWRKGQDPFRRPL